MSRLRAAVAREVVAQNPEQLFLMLEKALDDGNQNRIKIFIDNHIVTLLENNFAKAASLLSKASTNFSIDINSQIVLQRVSKLLEIKFPINEILRGLTVLGFGKKDLQGLDESLLVPAIIHCNRLIQNLSNTKSSAIINTLTHAKNLGLLKNKKYEKKITEISEKLFSYLSTGNWHMLSESNFRACLDLAVYFKYVLGIENENYNKLALNREIDFDSKISRSQKIIFNRIVNYLAHGFNNEYEWQYNVDGNCDEVRVGKFQVVSEYGYGDIGGKKIRSCDIAIVDVGSGEVKMMIEVDGKSHFCNIAGEGLRYNGKTITRDEIIFASCKVKVFHISYEDFLTFSQKEKSNNFLSLCREIASLRKELSDGQDISQDINQSYSIHEQDDGEYEEEGLPEGIQEIIEQFNIAQEDQAAAPKGEALAEPKKKRPKRKSKKAEKERRQKQENEKKAVLFTSFKAALEQEKIDFEELSLLFDEYKKLFPQSELIEITALFPNALFPIVDDKNKIDFVREIYDEDSVDLLCFLSRYVELGKIKLAYNKIKSDIRRQNKGGSKPKETKTEPTKLVERYISQSNENGFRINFLGEGQVGASYQSVSMRETLEKIQALNSINFINYFRLAVINKDYGLLSFIAASEFLKVATTEIEIGIEDKYKNLIRQQVYEAIYDCLVRDDLFTAKIILSNLLGHDRNMSLLNPKKHGQEKRFSLLARACYLSNLEFVKYFVEEAQFNINEFKELVERPPFFIANNPEICDFFIAHAFNPKEIFVFFEGNFELDALADACIFGDEEKLKYLLDRGFFTQNDLQEKWYKITENTIPRKLNPVLLAIFYNRHKFLQLLIEQGCDLNHRYFGLTSNKDQSLDAMEFALYLSNLREVLPTIKTMIDGGYKLGNKSIEGFTILHKICDAASSEVILDMIDNQDIRKFILDKTTSGATPLDILLERIRWNISRSRRIDQENISDAEQFMSNAKQFILKLEPSEFEKGVGNKILNFTFDAVDVMNDLSIQYQLSRLLFLNKGHSFFDKKNMQQLFIRAIVNVDVEFVRKMLLPEHNLSPDSFEDEINSNISSINPGGQGSKEAKDIAEICTAEIIRLKKINITFSSRDGRQYIGSSQPSSQPNAVLDLSDLTPKTRAVVKESRPATPENSIIKEDEEFKTPERPSEAAKKAGGSEVQSDDEKFYTPERP